MIKTAQSRSYWKSYLQLGKLAYERGLYAVARKQFIKAAAVIELLEIDGNALTSALLGLGLSCCQLKKFAEAEIYFDRIFSRSQQQLPSLELVEQLSEVAVFYQKKGQLDKADALLQQCLHMASGLNYPHVAKAKLLKSLALVNCKRDNLADAEKLLYQAMSLVDTSEVRTSKLFAEMLGVKSSIACKRGRFDEAEEWIEQAISILEVATGGQHPELADFLDYAADVFGNAQSPNQAEPLRARAKSMRAHIQVTDR